MATKPIVVGTDGSDPAMSAVEWAAQAAERRKAPLRIVSVVSVPPAAVWSRPLPQPLGSLEHSAAEQALAKAVARAAELAPSVLIDADLLGGSPARSLVASASGAHMLVVGSRGAGGFATLLLGSISRYAATRAPVPTVVVPRGTAIAHDLVAVGVRDPDSCAAALAFAFGEAALYQTSLLAVHAWYHPFLHNNPEAARSAGSPDLVAKVSGELSQVLGRYQRQYPGVQVSQETVQAHPGQVLADLSARTDLVVIGRRGGASAPGIGAVTHAVLNHAQGPVACVPGAN